MKTNCVNQYNWLFLRFLFAVLMAFIGSSAAAHDLDGTQKWVFRTGEEKGSSPAIGADATIYVGSDNASNDGNLYAINGSSGGLLSNSPWPMFHYNLKQTGLATVNPTVLVANFANGNNTTLSSRVYLFNPSQSAGDMTVRVFTLPPLTGTAQELGTPLKLGSLGARSAVNIKVVEDILIPLKIPTPYTTDGGNLTLEFTIEAADVRGAAQVFSSENFAFGTYPLQIIQ